MKQLLAFCPALFFIINSFGQENLIPKQYQPIKEIYGDLNKDSIAEKVVVYNRSDKEDEENGIDREVVIFRKEENKWKVWYRSTTAVGNSRHGGMMGDPFEDIAIKNGVLLITEAGGSGWKWGHTEKYRYRDNSFELIGYTSSYGRPCEYWEMFDYNIVTGKIVLEREYEKCDNDTSVVYKKESESFTYKLQQTIKLENRNKAEIKIISPKYKHELYL